MHDTSQPIPFRVFANFDRVTLTQPLFYCEPPEWAAAAHAIVANDTVHYLWGRRRLGNTWSIMHSTAPVTNPTAVAHDPRNPVVEPAAQGFDEWTVEYPFPFRNPADGSLCMYYLGKRRSLPKQTGLLVSNGDFGSWARVRETPVIAAEADYETQGSSHPSAAIDGSTIHIIYTGESDNPPVICHATAPTTDPGRVTKDSRNPVFIGSGAPWDSRGVREAEIFRGPAYYHLFYGGSDGTTWRVGHVRTRDFRTFEANPRNPVFTPPPNPDAWDGDGILTPQVFEAAGRYHMLYAGLKGSEWQSGLAVARASGPESGRE